VYRVDPAKVPAGGVRARCSVCNNVFAVSADGAGPAAAVAPAPASAPAAAPAVRTPARPPVAPPLARPTAPAPPAPAGRPLMPAAPPIGRPAAPAPPPAPAAPLRVAAAPAAPSAPPTRPAAAPPAAPPAAAPAAGAGGPGTSASGKRLTGPLRPVNPFMVQDPKQKARRLARALISDMLVYHPEKRQQGIRDGTLPQLFKDEIQKSWLEYTEQVGVELAQSTPFWTEALNEILGGGHKLF
jgi:hypothetical protein